MNTRSSTFRVSADRVTLNEPERTERIMIADLEIIPGDIDVPTTLLVGSLDKVEQPGRLREIFEAAVPETRFIEVPGVGHLTALDAPEAVASACRDMLIAVARSIDE